MFRTSRLAPALLEVVGLAGGASAQNDPQGFRASVGGGEQEYQAQLERERSK